MENPWLEINHENGSTSLFPFVPLMDGPGDNHPMFLVYEELARCSAHADDLRARNISRVEVLSKVSILIIQLVQVHKQSLAEVEKRLRDRDLHIWIFLKQVEDGCPFEAVRMTDMKTPTPFAMNVFLGTKEDFIKMELEPLKITLDQNTSLLEKGGQTAGVYVAK